MNKSLARFLAVMWVLASALLLQSGCSGLEAPPASEKPKGFHVDSIGAVLLHAGDTLNIEGEKATASAKTFVSSSVDCGWK
jgi:hypothetical protein